jgi:electron transport complex protein RnfG
MKNKDRIFNKTVFILPAISLICAILISGFYFLFTDQINLTKKMQDQKFKKIFFPEAAIFEEIQSDFNLVKDINGNEVGYIIYSTDNTGYSGTVKVMTALNLDWTIKDFLMYEHQETPGLGTIANESSFKNQIYGTFLTGDLPAGKKELEQDYQIQAISGATYTTIAVINAIMSGNNKYLLYWQSRVDHYLHFEAIKKEFEKKLYEEAVWQNILSAVTLENMSNLYYVLTHYQLDPKKRFYQLMPVDNLTLTEKIIVNRFYSFVQNYDEQEYTKNPRRYRKRL